MLTPKKLANEDWPADNKRLMGLVNLVTTKFAGRASK